MPMALEQGRHRAARVERGRVRSGIQQDLGREPNLLELGVFSRDVERALLVQVLAQAPQAASPPPGRRVLVGPGENAGVVDIGDGMAAAFKMESHNHPSYIEPYQGAATGVGGILRDVFTMGARPIASLNSLRFGRPVAPQDRLAGRRRGARASAATGTASACPPSAARSPSTRATTATAW